MSSMFSEMFHGFTGSFFEPDEPRPVRYREARIYGPCYHIDSVECDKCREAKQPVGPYFRNMVQCERCHGWFSQKDFAAHFDHCVGYPLSENNKP